MLIFNMYTMAIYINRLDTLSRGLRALAKLLWQSCFVSGHLFPAITMKITASDQMPVSETLETYS